MLRNVYLILSALVLGVYACVALTGFEFGTEPRETLDPSVRHTPHRTHFWFFGPHGGK
jgi:hypothetical protein